MSGEIQSYRDLHVWRDGMTLAENCYRATKHFPKDELFGMTSQIRRAAASVPANIAEGYGREVAGSYVQHLRIAQGSLKELETHLMLAGRVGLLDSASLEPLLASSDEVGRMLRALIRSIQNSSRQD